MSISKIVFIDKVFSDLIYTLRIFDNHPDSKTSLALNELITTLYDGLIGSLSAAYYLSSLDPGKGKTQAISSFIKIWKSNGFLPDGSILIGLKTKDEIRGLIRRLGLADSDFACLTRDDDINALGLGDRLRRRAKVLITTQQMIINRTSDRSFSAARDFYYEEAPRPLRIWDEAFVAAEPLAFKGSALSNLVHPLSMRFPALANEIHLLEDAMRDQEIGRIIRIPARIDDLAAPVANAIKEGKFFLQPSQVSVLDGLMNGAGRPMRLIADGDATGRALIGATRPIPADIAPLIITDASIRVRGTYDILESARRVIRLSASANRYENVRFHLWKRKLGKVVLSDPDASRSIYREVAAVMKEKPSEPWLVISYKATGDLNPEKTLRELLPTGFEFDFLSWGKHFGTNAFSTAKNVVIIGSYLYGDAVYRSLEIAAAGRSADEVLIGSRVTLRPSEFQHNFLQAVMRGHARNSVDGETGECDVYIIASKSPDPEPLLRETFPGCQIEAWGPPEGELTGNKKQLVDYLRHHFATGRAGSIRKRDVSKAIGLKYKSDLSRLLKDWEVSSALTTLGIVAIGQKFERRS